MSDKDLRITISSKLSSAFGSAFTGASKQVKDLRNEIIGLRKQQSLINKFNLDTTDLEKARSRLKTVQSEVFRLKKEMGAAGVPTKKMAAELAKATTRAEKLSMRVSTLKDKVNKSSGAMRKAGLDTKNVANEYDRLGNKINGLNGKYNQAKNQSRDLSTSTKSLTQSFFNLKNVLAGGIFAVATRGIVNMIDGLKNSNSLLKIVTSSSREYESIQKSLFQIAQDNFASIGAVTKQYAGQATVLKEMGRTQTEALGVVDLFNKSLTISGSTQAEGAAATLQWTQAMASGVLRGQEFNSIMENGRGVAIALANGLGVGTGALRGMAEEGKLTAKVVVDALLSQDAVIRKKFANLPLTASRGFTLLVNSATKKLEELNAIVGDATGGIGSAFKGLSKIVDSVNFSQIADAGILLASVLAARLTPAILGVIGRTTIATAALARYSVATASASTASRLLAGSAGLASGALALIGGPIGAAILGTAAAIIYLKNQTIKVGNDSITTSQYASAAWELFKGQITETGQTVDEFGEKVADPSPWTKVSNLSATMVRFQIGNFNRLIGVSLGAATAIVTAFKELPGLMGKIFAQVVFNASVKFRKLGNIILTPLNAIRESLGKEPIKINIPKETSIGLDQLSISANKVKNSFVSVSNVNFAGKIVDKIKSVDSNIKQLAVSNKKLGSSSDNLKKKFSELKTGLNESTKSSDKLTKAQKAAKKEANELAKAQEKITGVITTARQAYEKATIAKTKGAFASEVYALKTQGLNEKQAAAAARFKLATEEINKQIQASKASADALKKQKQSIAVLNTNLGKGETASIALAKSFDGMTAAQGREYAANQKTIKGLQDQISNRDKANELIKKGSQEIQAQIIYLNQGADAARLFELKTEGFSDAQAQAKLNIEKTSEALDRHGEVVGSINDAFTDAALDGFKSFKDLGRKIVDIFKGMVLRPVIQAVMAPISGAIGGLFGSPATPGINGAAGSPGGLGSLGSLIFGNSIGKGFTSAGASIGKLFGGGNIFSGAASYSNLAFGAAGLGGGLVGGLFGGEGSTGGSIGSTIGMAFGGPIGAIAGSVLGGLVGSLFGGKPASASARFTQDDPGFATYRSDNYAPGLNFSRTSELGYFGLEGGKGNTDVLGRSDQTLPQRMSDMLDLFVGLDNTIAGFSSDADIKKAQQNLKGFTIKTMDPTEIITERLSIIFGSLPEKIGGLVDLGKPVEEIVARIEEISGVSSSSVPLLQQYGFHLGKNASESLATAVNWGDQLKKVGESAAGALARTAVQFQSVKETSALLGLRFGATGFKALELSDSLVQAMGGLERFKAATTSYFENFYTDTEKSNIALATAATQIKQFNADLGRTDNSLIENKASFRKYIESLDLTSESGQEAFATAMNIQDSFIQLTDSGQTLNEALDTLPESALKTAKNILLATNQTERAGSQAESAIDGVNSALGSFTSKLVTVADSVNQVTSSLTRVAAANDDGSHYSGLYSVPKDNYKGNLHKKEMVLPARLAETLRSGGTLTGGRNIRDIKSSKASKRVAALLAAGIATAPLAAAAQGQAQVNAPVTQNITINIQASENISAEDIGQQVRQQLEQARIEAERTQRGRLHD